MTHFLLAQIIFAYESTVTNETRKEMQHFVPSATTLFFGNAQESQPRTQRKNMKMGEVKHGFISKSSTELQKKTYKIWLCMRKRCSTNATGKSKRQYFDLGTRVCDAWNSSFLAFFNDMGMIPSIKHTIDRKNSDLGYFKENCKWATAQAQALNRRNKPSKSGIKGAYQSRCGFNSAIKVNNKRIHLGSFKTKEDAGAAYDRAAVFYFGGLATTNKMINANSESKNGK